MFSKIHTLHLNVTEFAARGAMALATALVAFMMIFGSPLTASAATVASKMPNFPRLATWWGDNTVAGNAARDYYVPYNWDPIHPDTAYMASLRQINPNIILLASSSAAEINYSTSNNRNYDAEQVGAVPTAWLLTQVGSTLSSALTAGSTTIAVASTTNFRVDDLVVVEDEKCIVTAIGTGSLTVKRGYTGSTAVAHAAGTRIAAVVSDWAGAATINLTANCPLGRATGTYATPGTGTERAYDWLARRTAGLYKAASWDGVMIDVAVGNYAACFRGQTHFRTIASQTDPTKEADYAAFDTAWQAGLKTFLNEVRVFAGPDAAILTNGAPEVVGAVNGTTYECFPKSTTTAAQWHQRIVGPSITFLGAYFDWNANGTTPNLSTIMTFGAVNDYKLMRFGLTTALMGDGFFAYEESTNNHSSVGRWFDEYDNAGAGRGYLGNALAAAHTVASNANVYRRDFTGGVAIVNASDSAVTVQLGESFRKIQGTQDPTVNNGNLVTAVTLPAHDGIVLLRVPVAPVPTPEPTTTPAPVPTTTPAPVPTTTPAPVPTTTPAPVPTTTPAPVPTTTPAPDPTTTPAPVPTTTPAPDPTTTPAPVPTTTPDPVPTPDPVATPAPVLLATPVLRASDTSISYGQTTILRITVTPVQATTVAIEQRLAGSTSWVRIATLLTSANGTASFVVAPVANTDYRAIVVGNGSTSKLLTVQVKARATVRSSKSSVKSSGTVTLSGTVRAASSLSVAAVPDILASAADNSLAAAVTDAYAPAAATGTVAPTAMTTPLVRVALQRKVRHHWVTVKTITIDTTGGYRVSLHVKARGIRSYRIRVAGNGLNTAAVSRTLKIRVR